MNPYAKMFLDLEAERPSKKSDLETRLEGDGWTRISNHGLVSEFLPEMRLALATDEELYDYYCKTLGYKEVLVTEAHNRFGEPMDKNYRAVYVKGEPKKFQIEQKEISKVI